METIIEYRAYVLAKQTYDHAQSVKDLPDTPLIQLAKEFDFERASGPARG